MNHEIKTAETLERSDKTVKYHVRPYRVGEEGRLVEFLKIGFNGWPQFDLECTPLEHWEWKFLDNPLGLHSIVVVEIDDKIIGFSGEIYQYVKVGDKMLLASRGADLAVHPEYRRMGIATRLFVIMDELRREKGAQMSYGATGNPIIFKIRNKQRLRVFPHKLCEKVHIKDINLFLETYKIKHKLIKKMVLLGIINMNALKNAISFNIKNDDERDDDIKIKRIDKFCGRFNGFWESIKDDYFFIAERKQEYLNWRYCDKRGSNYYVNVAEQDGQILGYCVIRINRIIDGFPQGFIVDLLTLPKRLDAARTLLAHAFHYFDKNDVKITRVWLTKNHPHEILYRRHGFVEINRQYHKYLQVTPIEGGEAWMLFESAHPDQLHFQRGDLDWI